MPSAEAGRAVLCTLFDSFAASNTPRGIIISPTSVVIFLPVISRLLFGQQACFIAGQANSATTLLVALLDNHPELLVLPEETAYFPTVLTKYAPRGRRAQFDYLTKQSLSNVFFGGPCKWGKRNYATFPREKFYEL